MFFVNRVHLSGVFLSRWGSISLSRMTLLHKVVFSNYSPKIQYFTHTVRQPVTIIWRYKAACWQLPMWYGFQCRREAASHISGDQCQVFHDENPICFQGQNIYHFGGHSANESGLSPSISLSVFTTPPKYFGVSQDHVAPLFHCFSVLHFPLHLYLSVPYHPVLRYLSVNTKSPPRQSERIINAPYSHSATYNLRSVSCDLDPFLSGQWSH